MQILYSTKEKFTSERPLERFIFQPSAYGIVLENRALWPILVNYLQYEPRN